jgi:uroporphyrin-III C-methyltransferase / precorrin-2 dehydrogenase / sirohydrochlorin ferrochelatase
MRHFPAFLDLAGRSALVVGAGAEARRRVRLLVSAGAEVREAAHFSEASLAGCAVAIGADAPEAELRALSAVAQARGIPVNIVDRPELCSFIMPAVVDRDPLTIAISSGGVAPVLARLLRQRIERLIPPAFGRLAALVAGCTAAIRRWPDPARRRQLLERLYAGRVAELVLAGDDAAARCEMIRECERGAPDRDAIGTVFLVGAGPGAADLLTLRAHRLLGEADVIVHDRLVADEVLALARREAELIDVGKVPGATCRSQEAINELLVRLALRHRRIVRLKGGDPFIFGRGGEEAAALARAGVPYQVVPGVTAALACAAQARIPLTRRGIARSVTLVTGHCSDGVPDGDFAAAVRTGGTLAVYMGLATLPRLRDRLADQGVTPDTPAVLIESGGTHRQRELRGTLDGIVAGGHAWSRGGPTMLLIGDAVGSRDGAGDGNRTRIASLEGWSSTIELHPLAPSFTGPPAEAQSRRC